MSTLDEDFAADLLNDREPPCLSLYQPVHRRHPENRQDPIRFANLVKVLEESLRIRHSQEEIGPLLKPFLALAEDRNFWKHTLDGLAVLGAKDTFRVYNLQRRVPELAIVADSFHVKPLMRILQSADRYHVLAVSRQSIRLFEGNRDALSEIEPADGVPRTVTEALGQEITEPHRTVASYGGAGPGQPAMSHGHGGKESEVDIDAERFFRAVDRAVTEHHSRPSGLPLILAALPEHHHRFHEVSRNPFLIPESLDTHPDDLSIDELRERTWQILEPRYVERVAALGEEFGSATPRGLASDDPRQIAKAIAGGRVAKLLIEDGREIPGRVDAATGRIEVADLARPDVDDVLDDLAVLAQKTGSEVLVVPAEQMPTDTGLAAIYRY